MGAAAVAPKLPNADVDETEDAVLVGFEGVVAAELKLNPPVLVPDEVPIEPKALEATGFAAAPKPLDAVVVVEAGVCAEEPNTNPPVAAEPALEVVVLAAFEELVALPNREAAGVEVPEAAAPNIPLPVLVVGFLSEEESVFVAEDSPNTGAAGVALAEVSLSGFAVALNWKPATDAVGFEVLSVLLESVFGVPKLKPPVADG